MAHTTDGTTDGSTGGTTSPTDPTGPRTYPPTGPTVPAETQRARRGHRFYPPPVLRIPRLYATEGQPFAEKFVFVHYFAVGCDWWIAEYDPATGEAFGYACLGDPANAEWGYVHLPELERICLHRGLVVVERDRDWTPRPARDAALPGSRAT